MNKQLLYISIVALVIVGFVCIIAPELTGYSIINAKAAKTVDEALAENAKTFVLVSGLKAGLAIIEGSTAGAVFVDVEIGDLVQPSYDFVDHIWQFLFYGLLILSVYKFVLEFGLLSFGVRIIGVGLIVWAFGLIPFSDPKNDSSWTRLLVFFRKWPPLAARLFLLVGLLLAYLVPLTILASYSLRGYITEPVKVRQAQEIREFEDKFDMLKEEFLSIKDELSVVHPVESSGKARAKMRETATSLLIFFNNSLNIFLLYAVIIFVEVLVFPLLTAFVLYRIGQFIIDRFFAVPVVARNPSPSM